VARERGDVVTDQTTTPADADRARHHAVWNQLTADTAAFVKQHPGTLPIARLVWDVMVVAFARGARYGADRPNQRPTDAQIIAHVMEFATTADGAPPALRDLAYADVRAKRRAQAAEKPAPAEDGGNCDG
jgi:hypothetical protein